MTVEIPAQRAGWIKEHMEAYLRTGGKEGHTWRGVPTLLLTTTGSKSGKQTTTPLIYGRDGDRLLVVASKGGAADHPMWYKNLARNPGVEVQVEERTFKARARTATPDEKPPLWTAMAGIWPAYNDYQQRTERDIPVVILEPEE
jgi:deazaflavin-dependent oxidoreductase (nitroreductase family)